MPDFRSTDVDSRIVSDAAASIDGYIKELQSTSKTVQSGIMPNLTPYWQGPAKESFELWFTFFSFELENLIKGYIELNEQLKKAGTEYGKADDIVKQIMAKLPK